MNPLLSYFPNQFPNLSIYAKFNQSYQRFFPLALTIHFISWLLIKTSLCCIFVKWFSLGTWYTSCSVKKLKIYKYYFQFFGRKVLKGSCLMAEENIQAKQMIQAEMSAGRQKQEGPQRRVSHPVPMVKYGRYSCIEETHQHLPGEMTQALFCCCCYFNRSYQSLWTGFSFAVTSRI